MEEFDFSPYTNYEDMKGYDGFIDQAGVFYKVRAIIVDKYSNKKYSHSNFADQFALQNKELLNLKLSINLSIAHSIELFKKDNYGRINNMDLLVHILGYIRYSHMSIGAHPSEPYIDFPNYKYNKRKATSKQLDTLYMVMHLNKEKLYDSPFYQEYIDNEEFQNKNLK